MTQYFTQLLNFICFFYETNIFNNYTIFIYLCFTNKCYDLIWFSFGTYITQTQHFSTVIPHKCQFHKQTQAKPQEEASIYFLIVCLIEYSQLIKTCATTSSKAFTCAILKIKNILFNQKKLHLLDGHESIYLHGWAILYNWEETWNLACRLCQHIVRNLYACFQIQWWIFDVFFSNVGLGFLIKAK